MPAYGNMDIGFAGLKQGVGYSEVISRAASEEIAFGSPIYLTQGDQTTCSATAGAGKALVGVAMSTQNERGKYLAGEAVNILTQGSLLVVVADAVSANKPAYLTAAGAWSDETTDNTATPYFFRTAASAGGLAELEVIKKPAA